MGDCRTARCAAGRAMRENREVSSETDAHPEGLDLEISYSAVPIHDGAGRVVGGFEVVNEQTAMRRGEVPAGDDAPQEAACGGVPLDRGAARGG
jgi:hypothetical protein